MQKISHLYQPIQDIGIHRAVSPVWAANWAHPNWRRVMTGKNKLGLQTWCESTRDSRVASFLYWTTPQRPPCAKVPRVHFWWSRPASHHSISLLIVQCQKRCFQFEQSIQGTCLLGTWKSEEVWLKSEKKVCMMGGTSLSSLPGWFNIAISASSR